MGMTSLSRAEAWKMIKKTHKRHHVDKRIYDALEHASEIYLIELRDMQRFLSLIWRRFPEADFLTPAKQPRTLKDVANRYLNEQTTFEKLYKGRWLWRRKYIPEWFNKTRYLNKHFNYDKFGFLLLSTPTKAELELSPEGTFFVYDGTYRSMVLAKKLLRGEIKFQPVKGLLIAPRPGGG